MSRCSRVELTPVGQIKLGKLIDWPVAEAPHPDTAELRPLTEPQKRLVQILYGAVEPVPIPDLAARLSRTVSTVRAMLDRLRDGGWVASELRASGDRRARVRVVWLTEAGRQAAPSVLAGGAA